MVAVSLAAFLAFAVWTLLRLERGRKPPFLTRPAGTPESPSRRAAPTTPGAREGVSLAGSGSNLPLTRLLVEAFRRAHPGASLVVHESIGSTGGLRAVGDGAVSIGLVSRALTEAESKLGLVVRPYARVAVVVAAHPGVPDRCASHDELLAMFAGARARWSDGAKLVVLQRERGDSSFLAFSKRIPGLEQANEAAYRAQRWRVLYHDREMQEALMATSGAVGLFDLGAIEAQKLPLRVLCVEGVEPTREAVLAGRYPFTKELSLVTAGPPTGLVAELLEFVASRDGRAITERAGYLALPLEPLGAGSATP
jgi:phosphate transport system substrate-binding protein